MSSDPPAVEEFIYKWLCKVVADQAAREDADLYAAVVLTSIAYVDRLHLVRDQTVAAAYIDGYLKPGYVACMTDLNPLRLEPLMFTVELTAMLRQHEQEAFMKQYLVSAEAFWADHALKSPSTPPPAAT